MFKIIQDKIFTYTVYFDIPKEIPNLTPPLAASAIEQISSIIFTQEKSAGWTTAIGTSLIGISGAIRWKRRESTENLNGDIALLFGLGAILLAIGASLGALTWSRHRNFQQILLPRLQKIANS